MGVKPRLFTNAIAACVESGILRFNIGSMQFETDLGLPVRRLDFPKQCNMFCGGNVAAYLKNEEYSMYLYYDGFGEIVSRESNVLCMLFQYKPWDCEGFKEVSFGNMRFGRGLKQCLINGYVNMKTLDAVIYSEHSGFSATFNMTGNNFFLLSLLLDRGLKEFCFNIGIQDGNLYYMNVDLKPLNLIECELELHDEYMIF